MIYKFPTNTESDQLAKWRIPSMFVRYGKMDYNTNLIEFSLNGKDWAAFLIDPKKALNDSYLRSVVNYMREVLHQEREHNGK